jgi:hypothetical protein
VTKYKNKKLYFFVAVTVKNISKFRFKFAAPFQLKETKKKFTKALR